ncbi:hypothetical protein R6Q57_019508 [Mikania cordata]
MGGVGKTTLAKLLYNDPLVKKHFKLKGWVCISDDFDICCRTKDILKDLGGELKKELEKFNKLQETLGDYVRGNRFLLVLDDVWFESYTDWEKLVEPLRTCAPGSKIIITTRKDQLLRKLGCNLQNKQLESLLPLALIVLGTSLRTKEDEYSWKGVLESEIWNLPVEGEILPALRQSYHELSAPLKLDHEAKDTKEEMLEKYHHMLFVREEFVTYKKFEAFKRAKSLRTFLATSVGMLPLGIGELKSLQNLSKIIIGGKSGLEIAKIKYLENLCGEISIEGLEKVQNARNASVANFPQKRLSELEAIWSDEWDDSRNEMLEKEVLNELKPHDDKLIQLKVRSYGGLELPKWVGDPSFAHLKHVSLSGFKRCTSLPPLAQLQSLEELFIEDLDGVEVVGTELLGTCREFPSLEILSFKRMHGWEKWSMSNGEYVFPCLKQLVIEDCPNLVEVTLEKIHSLNVLKLENSDCGVLIRLVEIASSIIILEISCIIGLKDVVWRGVDHLGAVEKLSIRGVDLEVTNCDNLVSLGEKEYDEDSNHQIASLRTLMIFYCKNMERCSCPDSIKILKVYRCSSITSISFPTGGGGLKSLEIWGCDKLLERDWGAQNNNKMLLEVVYIRNWPNLKSIINLNCMVNVTRLEIIGCEGLESLPENELPNLKSLKHLHIEDCPRMDACFPHGLWPPNLQTLEIGRLKKPILEWGSQNFPTSLVELALYGGGVMSSCSQISNLLPSSLTSLQLCDFEKLESFSIVLQHLQSLFLYSCPNLHKLSLPQHLNNSLQHLKFSGCPNMKDLPEQLLPSLLSLSIRQNCPNLKERCSKGGSYEHLISHIPRIYIYNPGMKPYHVVYEGERADVVEERADMNGVVMELVLQVLVYDRGDGGGRRRWGAGWWVAVVGSDKPLRKPYGTGVSPGKLRTGASIIFQPENLRESVHPPFDQPENLPKSVHPLMIQREYPPVSESEDENLYDLYDLEDLRHAWYYRKHEDDPFDGEFHNSYEDEQDSDWSNDDYQWKLIVVIYM